MDTILWPKYLEFGYTSRGHKLVSGTDIEFPVELISLTDIPPSQPTTWRYTLNCGPIGSYYAIWCTKPDLSQTRSGSVKSKVAIWPINQVSEHEKIDNVINTLVGENIVKSSLSHDECLTILNTLIDSNIVCLTSDFKKWPDIISFLWETLWPNSRQNLSLHCVFKEQDTTTLLNPTLYCILGNYDSSWLDKYNKIENDSEKAIKNIVKYLLNKQGDNFLFFKELICEYNKLNELKIVEKIINSHIEFKQSPNTSNAIKLLRTCLSSKKENNQLIINLVTKSIDFINKNIENLDIDQIFTLGNILLTPGYNIEIQNWMILSIENNFNINKIEKILRTANEKKAHEWWNKVILEGFNHIINETNILASKYLTILSNPIISEIIAKMIIDKKSFESKLWRNSTFSKENVTENFLNFCITNDLSYVHALAVGYLYNAEESLEYQLSFNSSTSLQALVDNFPNSEIVYSIIETKKLVLLPYITDRIILDGKILDRIDLEDHIWVKVWLNCLNLNNKILPNKETKKYYITYILEKIISITPVYEDFKKIIQILYIDDEISTIVLNYEKRPLIWSNISSPQKELIINNVAEKILTLLLVKNISQPEPLLSQKIIQLAQQKSSLPPNAIIQLIQWNSISEKTARYLLSHGNWEKHANLIGKVISENSWKGIAKDIYSSYKDGKKIFKDTIPHIRNLLSKKDRLKLRLFEARSFPTSRTIISPQEIDEIVIELCTELFPERLKTIWLMAGGNTSDLITSGTIYDQWVHAIKSASNGKTQDYPKNIATILYQEFPHNKEVKQLVEILE